MKLLQLFLAAVAAAIQGGDQKVKTIGGLVVSQQAQTAVHSLYAIAKTGGSTTIKLTDQADSKTIGINNYSQSMLAQNQLFYLNGIRITGVVLAATPTADTMKAANFGSIKGMAGLQNGEIDITCDGKIILKDFPLSNCVTDGNSTVNLGYVHLGIDKLIPPQSELKIEIRTGSATDANGVLKVELIGAATVNG